MRRRNLKEKRSKVYWSCHSSSSLDLTKHHFLLFLRRLQLLAWDFNPGRKWIFPFIVHTSYLFLIATPVTAQIFSQPVVPPPEFFQPVVPPPEPRPEPERLPPPEELLPPLEAPPDEPQPPAFEIPGTIFVSRFEVIGSTVFSEEELAEVLKPFEGRSISFAELLQAQEAVTELYRQQGYITSGAFIPPQALKDGVVKIEVLEGEVEKIEITGLERLNPGYVRSRLAIATKAPLNQNRLLEALQLLQFDPLIEKLSAELASGSRLGFSILAVEVLEAPAFSAQLRIDNQRSPSVGSVRRIAQITHANLLGFGDRFNIRYFNTDGSNSIDDLSYNFPLNSYNGTIAFRYRLAHNKIIEEPLNELDIESDYRQYAITYRQPILQTPSREFTLGLTGDRQESDFSLLDLLEGKTRISALRFFQEYTQRSNREVFAVRSQFNIGIEALETDLNGEETEENFFVWRGQAQYVRLLTPDTTLLLRSDLQLADRPVFPVEQFSLGGALTVRGYRQDLLLADNGFFASAEVRTSILRIPEWETTLQLTPFFDFGTAWNSDGSPVLPRQSLYSFGLGLRLLIGDNFNARLDWGIPLADVEKIGDSLQENGLYFVVEYNFRI